jgi:hypothetical protein
VTLILFLISQILAKLVEILLERKKKKKKKTLAKFFWSKKRQILLEKINHLCVQNMNKKAHPYTMGSICMEQPKGICRLIQKQADHEQPRIYYSVLEYHSPQ